MLIVLLHNQRSLISNSIDDSLWVYLKPKVPKVGMKVWYNLKYEERRDNPNLIAKRRDLPTWTK